MHSYLSNFIAIYVFIRREILWLIEIITSEEILLALNQLQWIDVVLLTLVSIYVATTARKIYKFFAYEGIVHGTFGLIFEKLNKFKIV